MGLDPMGKISLKNLQSDKYQELFLKIHYMTRLYIHLNLFSGHLEHKYLLFLRALTGQRRDGRVVECGGLENRCSPSGEPGVRIPLSPPSLAIALPQKGDGEFYFWRASADAVRLFLKELKGK